MIDNQLTLIGNVATEPDCKIVGSGVALTRFRVASTQRRYDKAAGEWRDGSTTFLSVTCWRRLAEHAAETLRRGDPVVVAGRLVGRTFEGDGRERYVVELEASAVGPDLSRARVAVQRGSAGEPRGRVGGTGGEPGSGSSGEATAGPGVGPGADASGSVQGGSIDGGAADGDAAGRRPSERSAA